MILVAVSLTGYAQYSDDEWQAYPYVGTTMLDVQKITIGARQAAMGEAFTGLADDINTSRYNPAGFGLLNYKTLSASHNEWLAESNYNFFTFGLPYGKGTFVAGLTYFDQGEIRESNAQGQYTGDVLGSHDFQFSLGYATKVDPWLLPVMYMGLNARFIQNSIGDESRGAFLGDIGVLIKRGKFSLGYAALNLGSGMDSVNEPGEHPPVEHRFGLGLNLIDSEAIDLNLAGDMNFRDPVNKSGAFAPRFNIGGEIWLRDMIAFRSGYKIGYDLEDVTMGAGFKLKDYQIDYAYVEYGDTFNGTHRLTATMTFGKLARADRDGDGIPDDFDRCPNEPEDEDNYDDSDGCPELDNDRDGIFDDDDKCPNMPEYYNGFEDEDGCPDAKPAEAAPAPVPEQEIDKTGATGSQGHLIGDYVCDDTRGLFYLLAGYDYVRPVIFDTDEYTIKPESKPTLEQIAQIIEQCIQDGDMVEVRGHADDRGDVEYNQNLSELRANAVRDYMISNFNLPADMLIAVGAGETEPLMPNTSPEYMQFNRRVVFRVIESE
jgi:outer membrane protein OmpA-like peptidoglycan-associated protein